MAASFPHTIDRFQVRRVLGEGSQGVVYLAHDPELKRQVAIKSVSLTGGLESHDDIEQLIAEARTVSRLQHANVVSIFDIGMQDRNPYLVLEYIDGQPLQQKITAGLGFDEKLNIMRDIIAGVAAAHAEDIVHCDLKPANILISEQGQAKVADFGLAWLTDPARSSGNSLYGTPQYMAPEYLETHRHQKVSDVFSLGLICYELLTGETPFKGKEIFQVLNAIATREIVPPSRLAAEVDERLDALIMKSLARQPTERYADAGRMLEAFNDYLALDNSAPRRGHGDATARFLLRRMRHKKDFPAFSHTISVLNQASSSETESLAAVSNAILKDYSLTNKVLRLVNSAYYNRGGGKVGTISRALVMLGIDTVRSIAVGLMLFEHLHDKLQAHQLKEQSVQALFSGLLANSLARSLDIANHEEAFLCALLQQLGKMLVRFYLHEEARAIDKLMAAKNCSETAAATEILGTSYARLGFSVASEWGFPKSITECMLPLDFEHLPATPSASEKLKLVAQFSSSLAYCLTLPLQQQAPAINRLTGQFGRLLDLDGEKVSSLLENCHKELTRFARLIQFDLEKSIYYQQISSSGSLEPETPEVAPTLEIGIDDSVEILVEQSAATDQTVEKALIDGIQDITATLAGEYRVNQVLQMVLETVYRAFDGVRVVLCLKDGKSGEIRARFGYGDDVQQLIECFAIPRQSQPDVFRAALVNNVDIRIEDSADAKIRDKLPGWYHERVGARCFTIFPVVVRDTPLALIYIDSARQRPVRISGEQLGLLKTLRNQIVLAIKHSA